jgi:hypothetical protein
MLALAPSRGARVWAQLTVASRTDAAHVKLAPVVAG